MSSDPVPVTIKKYANRRLYNTGTSAYVTLEDLATMVKRGSDFVVTDAKNGENITRSVLAQIIFEQEGKHGQSLLPITFLRQLIRFYGTSMQMLVPSFLEFSLANFAREKGLPGQAFPALNNAAAPMLTQMEEQTRQNMAMFRQAMALFAPFAPGDSSATPPQGEPPTANDQAPGDHVPDDHVPSDQADHDGANAPTVPPSEARSQASGTEFDDMRRQLDELQRRVERMATKS